jgi:hypothetical protein
MIKSSNRQHGSIPEQEFNDAISCISEVFGESWLVKKSAKRNLIKEIWQRRDFISSMELFFVGSALQKIVGKIEYRDWLNDFLRRAKSSDDGNAIGAIYESVMYSMLADNPGVALTAAGQEGYDFTAKMGEGTIRYSCKRLQVSDEEKKSRREFDELKLSFKEILHNNQLTGLHAILYGLESASPPRKDSIEKAVVAMVKNNSKQTQLGNYRLFLKELAPKIDDSRLNLKRLSYATTLIRPLPKSEQTRFEDLFRRAVRNFTKHSPNPSDIQINALMIGLPESISVKKAKDWVDERFSRKDSSRIAMVILTKFLPAADVEKNATLNSLQLGFCFNNNYDSASIDFLQRNAKSALKYVVPIGTISEKSADLHLFNGSSTLPIENSYVHQFCEIHHEMDFKLPIEIKISAQQDTRQTVTFVSDIGTFEIEPIEPPEFRYLVM